MAKAKGSDVPFARLVLALYTTLMKDEWIDSVFTMHKNVATSMIYFLQACMDENDSPEFVLPRILRMKDTASLQTVSQWQNTTAKIKVKLTSTQTLSLLDILEAIDDQKLYGILRQCETLD